MNIVERMIALAARFEDSPVRAFHDPSVALANRPCLLVTPPVIDWTEGAWDDNPQVQWRIVALSSYEAGTLDAVVELDDLVQVANTVLALERATPARYQLTATSELVPAYLCTHTEIED